MNAAAEVFRLLDQHKAVLVRQNNHLVYRLPNGRNFVLAKTPGDPARAAKNSLAELRRALGIVRTTPAPKGVHQMSIEETTMSATTMATTGAPKESLRTRIEALIARTEQEQEALLAAAQKTERRIQMLKAVLPFSEDAAVEEVLRAIMPQIEPPSAEELRPPDPPQHITERVQVTRQLVLAATQTFGETFTVNDVMARMTGGAMIDGEERHRVRSSIAQAMISLFDRGELIRVAEGFGKRQAIWKKAVLNGKGHNNGIGTRA